MEIKEMTIEQLEERKVAIAVELDNPEADLQLTCLFVCFPVNILHILLRSLCFAYYHSFKFIYLFVNTVFF